MGTGNPHILKNLKESIISMNTYSGTGYANPHAPTTINGSAYRTVKFS